MKISSLRRILAQEGFRVASHSRLMGEIRVPNGGSVDRLAYYIDLTDHKIWLIATSETPFPNFRIKEFYRKLIPIDAELLVSATNHFMKMFPSMKKGAGPRKYTWRFGVSNGTRSNQDLSVGIVQEAINSWIAYAQIEGNEFIDP